MLRADQIDTLFDTDTDRPSFGYQPSSMKPRTDGERASRWSGNCAFHPELSRPHPGNITIIAKLRKPVLPCSRAEGKLFRCATNDVKSNHVVGNSIVHSGHLQTIRESPHQSRIMG